MRQFLTPRYWLTLLALGGLVLVVNLFVGNADGGVATAPALSLLPEGSVPHRADLVQWVSVVQAPAGIEFVDGKLVADVRLAIDATRTMVITAGTPGENTCPKWSEGGQCIVAADLLGDAVLWFSLVPGTPGATIKLPGVVEALDDNLVRLANGWIVRRVSVVERSCDEETTSLKDFVGKFGDAATATFDYELQKVVKVTCPRTSNTTTTEVIDTSVPATETTVPGGSTTTLEPG